MRKAGRERKAKEKEEVGNMVGVQVPPIPEDAEEYVPLMSGALGWVQSGGEQVDLERRVTPETGPVAEPPSTVKRLVGRFLDWFA